MVELAIPRIFAEQRRITSENLVESVKGKRMMVEWTDGIHVTHLQIGQVEKAIIDGLHHVTIIPERCDGSVSFLVGEERITSFVSRRLEPGLDPKELQKCLGGYDPRTCQVVSIGFGLGTPTTTTHIDLGRVTPDGSREVRACLFSHEARVTIGIPVGPLDRSVTPLVQDGKLCLSS